MVFSEEDHISPEEHIIPGDFQQYLPNFNGRMTDALHQPPVWRVLYADEGWTSPFKQWMQKVDQICAREGVCGHGLDNHLLYVTQNAFVLGDVIKQTNFIGNMPELFSDPILTGVALIHDVAYGMKHIKWRSFEALDHERKSAEFVDRIRINVLPQTLEDTETLKMINELAPTIYDAILHNTDHRKDIFAQIRDVSENPSSEGLFSLTIMLADKLDFFRSARVHVDGVEVPNSYEDNPYIF